MIDHSKIEIFTDDFKAYLQSTQELVQMQITERIAVLSARFISHIYIGIAITFCLLFISLSLAFYLSVLLNNTYFGFAIIAGFFMLVLIILYLGRKPLVEKPTSNNIIRKLLNTDLIKH